MKKEQVIQDYMAFRQIECKNKDALTNYERYLRRFLKKAKDDLNDIDEAYLTKQVNSFSKEFSQTSLNNIKPLLKNFVKWYFPDYSLKFRNLDKLCKTKRAKSTYSAEEMLSEKEVKKIIETETDLFWKVFWAIFFYGGFRGIDVVRLKWEVVSFEKDGTTIIKAFIGKNEKTFYKCIPAEVTPLIQKWKEVNPSEWVFPSTTGDKPIHHKTSWVHLARTSQKALGKKINPYRLRHSFATIKYNEDGADADIVADQLGHTKSMRETYLHLDDKALIKRAKKVWAGNDLPEERKHELLKRIEEQDKKILNMQKQMALFLKKSGKLTP